MTGNTSDAASRRLLNWLPGVALMLSVACSQPSHQHSLQFEQAWVRSMPPGSMMTAGFGRLVNDGREDLEIIAYSSPQFASVSLHRSVLEAGVSRMEEVPALDLVAGSEFELAPGDYHLMFMRPVGQIPETVVLQIEVAGDRHFRFEMPLERR